MSSRIAAWSLALALAACGSKKDDSAPDKGSAPAPTPQTPGSAAPQPGPPQPPAQGSATPAGSAAPPPAGSAAPPAGSAAPPPAASVEVPTSSDFEDKAKTKITDGNLAKQLDDLEKDVGQ
jgi:hypothetical protein